MIPRCTALVPSNRINLPRGNTTSSASATWQLKTGAAGETMIRREGGEPAKYKGVWQRRWGRWVSEIRLPNSRKRIWLGSYDSPEKAARAFDAAAFCLRGHGAALNFPDNPPRIVPRPGLTPQEIQAAAARHANEGAEAKEAAEAPMTEVGEGRPEFPSFDEFGDEYFAEQIPPPPPPSPPPGAESGAFYCTSESSFLWNFEEF